ncbi:MAG: DNA alkylation repair protein, partial [Planctomycetes bacterium]|nr:DNA alkylation repair protein [Planctomycetota bacterium]
MNFGREQALLRQRLTAQGSEERATQQQAQFGDGMKCLGASDDEVLAAATDLVEQFPEMGRAQMTAFVRTLWSSKTH